MSRLLRVLTLIYPVSLSINPMVGSNSCKRSCNSCLEVREAGKGMTGVVLPQAVAATPGGHRLFFRPTPCRRGFREARTGQERGGAPRASLPTPAPPGPADGRGQR